MKKYLYSRDLLLLTTGSLIIAIAVNTFIANHGFAFGGVSGIAVIANELFAIHLAITYWALNIPLFWLSRKTNGLPFMVKSIISTSIVSLFLLITEPLQFVSCVDIVAAISGGVLMGIGVGLVICGNGSTGGTTLVACILHERYKVPLWTSILMVDGTVILSGAAIFGLNKAFFSILLVLCLARTVEYVVKYINTPHDKTPSIAPQSNNAQPV